MTVYVSDYHVSHHKSNQSLILKKQGKVLDEIEFIHIENLILIGPIEFSTALALHCVKRGIDIHLLNGKGRYIGKISGGFSKNIDLRYHQFCFFSDTARTLAFGKTVVLDKLQSCIDFISDKNHKSKINQADERLTRLESTREQIKRALDSSSLLKEMMDKVKEKSILRRIPFEYIKSPIQMKQPSIF